MIAVFSFLSVFTAIISAAYLQLPTFLLSLGYRWFYQYQMKRWIWRGISIVCFTILVDLAPPLWLLMVTCTVSTSFIVFSLVNANPRIYIALDHSQIIKEHAVIYPFSTQVLGYVDTQGHAICYPVEEMIKPRHLLNDVVNRKPVLISYCMACRSAMVYNAVVHGLRLKFEVLGVYRRNMVMRDTTTGTIWQQGTGEAVYGPLKGAQLEMLPYQQTSLLDWIRQYPSSSIAKEASHVKDGIFSKERLMKMMEVTESLVTPGETNLAGLPLREPIFGIKIGGFSKAYPIAELRKKNRFIDKVGNYELQIEYDAQSNFIRVLNLTTRELVTVQSHWWLGWKEFHQDTEIWTSNNQTITNAHDKAM